MTTNLGANAPSEVAYFAANTGELTCSKHGGMYLTSELKRRPNAKRISTPLAVWERLNSLEIAMLKADLGFCCETCHYSAKREMGA
jgi:hypothetical protein